MTDAALTRRGEEDLPGLRLRSRDQLAQILHRQRRMHHHDVRPARDLDHRRDIGDRIEAQLVQARVHGVAVGHEGQGVAVGRRLDAGFDADHAAGAGAVLHHELLPQRR